MTGSCVFNAEKAGTFKFPFAPALNKKGEWRFTVKDAVSGIEGSCRLKVD